MAVYVCVCSGFWLFFFFFLLGKGEKTNPFGLEKRKIATKRK